MEHEITIIIKDDFGRAQTRIKTELSPPQLLDKILNTLEEDNQESQKIGYLLHQQQTKETLQKYLESVILLKKVPGVNNLVLTGYIDLIHNIANDLNITLDPIQKP